MRAPVAEKLAELRAKIGRIEKRKTPRKKFTPAQRRGVADAFDGMCGCGCEESLQGQTWEIDHVIPLALGGAHEPGNWMPLLEGHHARKTSRDRKNIARAERIRRREEEGAKPPRLKGKGFDGWRKFDGSIVRRGA